MSVTGKAFALVLLNRMKDVVGKILRENKAGFSRSRGCIDQIFCLRILLEKCLEFQIQAVTTFVDFKTALNSEHLMKIMKEYGIPGKIRSIIRNTYSGYRKE